MESQLAQRIRIFRDSGRVTPAVAEFVADELRTLAAEGHTVTDATAGMLTSHLLMALTRVQDGAAVPGAGTGAEETVADQAAEQPRALVRAHAVSVRAEQELGAPLPVSEINFLAMHLAVLGTAALGRGVRGKDTP